MTNPDKPTPNPVFSIRQTLAEVRELTRREPVAAAAAAFGVGLLINLLPTRVVVGTITAIGAVLIRPALLTLGAAKAMELCCQNHQPEKQS